MNTSFNVKQILLGCSLAIALFSCKKNFDEPPYNVAVNEKVNKTIASLKSLHQSGGYETINDTVTIRGIVIANDVSGNLYKEIYIQDSTGALDVKLDGTSLYGSYPVGKEIFIKCKGLTLSDYGGMIQLGMLSNATPSNPALEGIPPSLFDKYITKGSMGNKVEAKTVTSIGDLGTSLQSPDLGMLIKLNGYEFTKTDLGRTYADTSAQKGSVNLTLKDCDGSNSIIVRSSGYSNFAGVKAASGNGSVMGIYTVFRGTKQLILRDTSDVKLTNPRCFLYEEDFNSYATTGNNALAITGWKNIMQSGDVPFTLALFSGSTFPKISAYNSTAMPTTNIESWLISPAYSLPAGTTPKFSFTCARRYPVGTLKVYASTNYNGSNHTTATWDLLTSVPAGTATSFTSFDLFGPFDFTKYVGQSVNIAFKYEAPAGTSKTSVATYEPDDLKISSK